MQKTITMQELLSDRKRYIDILDPKVEYKVGRFTVSISKDIVTRFEENVYDLDSDIIHGYTRFYDNNQFVNDEVMSAIVTGQLLREIYQYV